MSPWKKLLLNPVHLYRLPVENKVTIDTSVIIGKNAKKPLKLAVPIIISGMSLLKEEREAAKYLIGQYSRGGKNTKPEELRQLNAIEIQLGQGARASNYLEDMGVREHNPMDV
ncbi:MAG: hypothetical protein CVU87_06525 [Firmicutes bacterium HGW-Firmicutes-12]|nr:MAG: hypothetical protein CVU87_06525 [Firmicutes bacterium HGW-Firmicutes-12]